MSIQRFFDSRINLSFFVSLLEAVIIHRWTELRSSKCSFEVSSKIGGKKKITRDAKLFRILTFRFFDITHFLSGVSYARTHKLNAWVDKKFAIVETRLWKERVVNNGYTSMSRQRSSVIARLVHLDHGSDPALNRLFLQPIFSSCNF